MLQGKTVLVTGAARGLGAEFVRVLSAAGAKVVAGDLSDCAETVASASGEALALRLDVTDMASVQEAADAAVERFGSLDILINNAALYGGMTGGRFEKLAPDEWDRAMNVNVKGIWHCCKAAVPAMRRAGGGSIVNVSSVAALYGTPYALHYTTSKAAVIGLTRGLARELGPDNIRVNAIAPSAVMTEGTKQFFGERLDKSLTHIAGNQAIHRNLMPGDISGAVLWLASDQSVFVTGQTIAIDGGTVML